MNVIRSILLNYRHTLNAPCVRICLPEEEKKPSPCKKGLPNVDRLLYTSTHEERERKYEKEKKNLESEKWQTPFHASVRKRHK